MVIVIQIAGIAIAAVGLLLIWQQLRLGNKQAKFQALTELHKELISKDMQEALRLIYSKEPDELATPSIDELPKIQLVLNTYDLIGFRVKQKIIPKKETLQTEWMVLLRIWKKLKKFVEKHRTFCGKSVPYKKYFEELCKMAERFQKEHYPDSVVDVFKPKEFTRQVSNTAGG